MAPFRKRKRIFNRSGSFKRLKISNKSRSFPKKARRSFKTKRSSKRYVKSKRSSSRKSIKWETGPVSTIFFEDADRAVVPVTTTTSGKQSKYFYPAYNHSTSDYAGFLNSVKHFLKIGDQLPQIVGGSYILETKFMITSSKQVSEIVNQSTAQIHLTAYKCMFRRDIPNVNSGQIVDQLLGDGFYQRGYGVYTGYNNNGLNEDSLTPYDSHKFTSLVKILSQKTHTLEGGALRTFSIFSGKLSVNLDHYISQSSGATSFVSAPLTVAHRKGEMFYLFKMSGQPYNDTTLNNNIGATAPAIDMITKTHYNYTQLSPRVPNIIQMPPQGYGTVTAGQTVNTDTSSVFIPVDA